MSMSRKRYFGFSAKEGMGVVVILSAMFVMIAVNMRVSLRKARDVQRKSDVRAIYDALIAFRDDTGKFPFSTEEGKIVACGNEVDEKGIPVYRACEWYGEGFHESMPRLLGDPRQGQGRSYFYLSNGKHFQIFAALESEGEDEYNEEIVSRNLLCGRYVCNFGRSDGKTPLDKSLEDYERELEEARREKMK